MYKQSILFSVIFVAISAQAAQQPVAQQNSNVVNPAQAVGAQMINFRGQMMTESQAVNILGQELAVNRAQEKKSQSVTSGSNGQNNIQGIALNWN